jgi:hypothetical protein
LLFNFALGYASKKVKENQKKTEAVLIAIKEVCLEVKSEEVKNVFMSRYQNTKQNRVAKICCKYV